MINGNLDAFLDSLALGLELEVCFHGERYFIQGWDSAEPLPAHIEMFKLKSNQIDPYIFKYDGNSRGDCAREFLAAKIWDGKTFDEVEQEIEWLA